MFYLLSKLIDVLLSPLWWALLLALLGVRWRGREPGRARRWIARSSALVLLLFSTGNIAGSLLASLERQAVDSARADGPPYDTVVVLGGIVEESAMRSSADAPSLNDNVERVLEGVRLVRAGRARTVLLSAGSSNTDPSKAHEAPVLRSLLRQWGLSDDQIIIEDRSRNTRENALESARIIRERGFARVLAVTSAFHGRRAQACFRAVGLRPDWAFVDRRTRPGASFDWAWEGLIPRAKMLAISEMAIRETAGYWIYRAQGYAVR